VPASPAANIRPVPKYTIVPVSPGNAGPSAGALVIGWQVFAAVDVAACTQLLPPGDAVNSGWPPNATVQLPELAPVRSNFQDCPAGRPRRRNR